MDSSDPNHIDKRTEVSREWSEGLTAAAARAAHDNGVGNDGGVASRARMATPASGRASPPVPDRRAERADMSDIPADLGRHGAAAVKQARRHSRERIVAGADATTASTSLGGSEAVLYGAEKDAAHFKMVAARFRALMERRERRLEEAMSDPQTRTDLEAMFPGIKEGDYQTLLAGVRGMEEEDFQALLAGARKRRREVRAGSALGFLWFLRCFASFCCARARFFLSFTVQP